MIKSITDAFGDLNLIANAKENSAEAAAAMHTKCLICDKPVLVTTQQQRVRTAKSRAATAVAAANSALSASSTMPHLGYSKSMDAPADKSDGKQSMFNRLTSPNRVISGTERAKVVTELAIIRSSIDPLPEIVVVSAFLFHIDCLYRSKFHCIYLI